MTLMNRRAFVQAAACLPLVASTTTLSKLAFAQAATLSIGMAAPNTTLDPHLQSNAPNNAVASHIFDALVTNDEKSESKPGLASSWRLIDDLTWEFELNPDAVFSDGTPFTAEDVIASINRVNTIASITPYTTYTRSIAEMTVPEEGKLIIRTKEPDPLLLNSLSRIRVVSKKFADADTGAFNSGTAAIGTGPFVLREYVPGNRLVLARNETYWGDKPAFETVTLRIITDEGARLASLLSGDLDLVEEVPFQGIARVEASPNFKIIRGVSSRIVFMSMDQDRDVSPFVTGNDGKPLEKNPFKDERVRRAVAMAINREALVERVMEGNAVLASQYLPSGGFGTSEKIESTPYDPEGAKALLAEAGYPEGFKVTVHGPNDRYVNDARITQAVAQFMARIGIQTQVDVMPWSVYSGRLTKGDFSFFLSSWGVNTGETSNPLLALNVTRNSDAGTGASNYGRYSNPEVDKLVMEAKRTLDDEKRRDLLARASEIVFSEYAIVPLHNEVTVLGGKRSIDYLTRADQYTLAQNVRQSS